MEFNGKTLVFLAVNGEYWIALKPICEVLNIDFSRQLRTLKEDSFFGQLWSIQTIVAADGKNRQMACLPEEWIYGWIIQLESKSAELGEYKKECYSILYKHFHGSITGRKELLAQKAKAQVEIDRVMNTLDPNDAIKLDRANKTINQVNAKLRALDGDLLEEERTLFNQS